MNWLNLIRRPRSQKQQSQNPLPIRIVTDKNHKAKIVDSKTGNEITNVKVLYMHINSYGKISAELTVTDVEVDLAISDIKIEPYENT